VNTHRLAVAVGGLLLSTVVLATPVLAASVPTQAAPDAVAAAPDPVRCLDAWLAARATPSVETFRKVGDCEVDRRLDTIATLRDGVAKATALTDDHRSALTAILDRSEEGLTALRGEIDGDATLADLRTDVHRVFADYRIYALVARQVALVRADDLVAAAADRLTGASDRIAAAIATAEGSGRDVAKAKQHLDAMRTAIAAARSAVEGDAAALLPLTPADWNAGTARPVLDAARASVRDARGDLRTAVSEARAAIAALK
jgi:hypothetical protein